MKILRASVLELFCLLAAIMAAPASPTVSVASLLKSYLDLSDLPRLSYNVVSLASSYDRSGGNADFGNFPHPDTDHEVMAEMDGPGAIVRLWSANPNGELKIFIDNSLTPVIDVPFASISQGGAPFTSPLSGFSSGGNYTYLPIPFARHCKVVVDNSNGLYYQVGTVKFPHGTVVRSFSLPLSQADQAAVDAVNARWSSLAMPPQSLAGLTQPLTIAPGATRLLAAFKGPGVVTEVRLALPDTANLDLRRIILRAHFDGHAPPDIEAPVGDFFGNPVERKPFRSLLLGCAADGAFVADFPMPFARSARFILENRTARPIRVAISADFKPRPFDRSTTGYFHARWWREETRPGMAHMWIKTAGQRGHLVGIAQSMAGTTGLGYLEGDDQFRMDSQSWTPAPLYPTTVIGPWNGTGTEDCFNSGGYFDHGPNALPMNGLLEKWSNGLIVTYRWFVNDVPTFQHSIDGQIEHGGLNDSRGEEYASVSYWYSNGPAEGLPVISPTEDLDSPETLVPQFFVLNAIEGESLTPTISGGVAERQWLGAGWSDEYQLWWRGAAVGDTLTVSLMPPKAGTYELYGFFTKAHDYGQVTFAVNGTPMSAAFDGYAPVLTRPTATDIGRVTLPAGASPLVVTIAGKNAAATDTLFGVDCLVLAVPGSPAPIMESRIR